MPADAKMTKVVIRVIHSPATGPSPGAKPKTVYHVGNEIVFRGEDGNDVQIRTPLFDYDVDMKRRTAVSKHGRSPKDFRFMFAVPEAREVKPQNAMTSILGSMLFGTEWDTANSSNAKKRKITLRGRECDDFQAEMGPLTMSACFLSSTQTPWTLRVFKDGALWKEVDYDEYKADLAVDESLFILPPDVAVKDGN
jgi:hypothetical protein